jgi:AcrR family transcriptional regulator
MNETKGRILEAAERLIADHGFEVSLRAITTEAGVNLAAVNYHFQSKDALIDAVIARCIVPINQMRLDMLDAVEREHPSGKLPLDRVLHAFVDPALLLPEREHVRILVGRLYGSPDEFLRRLFEAHLKPLLPRFQAAFGRAVPGMALPDHLWCMHFTVGIMVHSLAWSRLAPAMTNNQVNADDTAALADRIVRFAAAGYRAASKLAASHEGTRHA